MDFFVREVRAVTTGPLRIIRLGSCAGLRPDLPVGTVAVASEGSILVTQNPDAWMAEAAGERTTEEEGGSSAGGAARRQGKGAAAQEPYVFHGVAEADEELSRALLKELERSLGGEAGRAGAAGGGVVGCLNASADSFYGSQGGGRGGPASLSSSPGFAAHSRTKSECVPALEDGKVL